MGNSNANTFHPNYQLGQIEAGHRLLPSFYMSDPAEGQIPLSYWTAPLAQAAGWGLPVCFVGSQWETLLYTDPAMFSLPLADNPNVTTADGQVLAKVSPFGPVGHWQSVGQRVATAPRMADFQSLYPEPPFVLWLANNEAKRLTWPDAAQDSRYKGSTKEATEKVQAVSDGWIERYPAMLGGLREGLASPAWRSVSRFAGYAAFGPRFLGRMANWRSFGMAVPGRIDPNPLMWEGGSPPAYLYPANAITDYQVMSPQVESQNFVFMQEEARSLNPSFWFEVSVWDGHTHDQTDKRAWFAAQGQTYNPARYKGMVRFLAWLLRPRVVREFRLAVDTTTESGEYFAALMAAVDEVHDNPALSEFWREGALVPNRAHPHPYQTDVPADYQDRDRWFMLDTDLDPPRPWTLATELPVFALALQRGLSPRRKWLVYAHSPLGRRDDVRISIPDGMALTANVDESGSFFSVVENCRNVSQVA